MKKTFLLSILLFPLGGFGLFAQSVVRVTDPTVTTGASPSITFQVGWTNASTSPLHRDTVWLFADYQVLNTDGTTEAWQPATITGVVHSGGTPSYPVALPYRGFYLDGHGVEPFASTITITLAAPVDKRFNACVYASDYPPNATQQPTGGYVLKGTPPFIINGTIRETTHTFGAGTCITRITDSTGCPGFVIDRPIITGEIASTGETICVGGTPSIITGTTAHGGDGQLSYTWYVNDTPISGATDANYTPPTTLTAGVYTYTRKVNDKTCNISPVASTGSWVLTVEANPTITLLSDSDNLAVGKGTAMPSINYLTTNATGATVTGLPSGVSGSWTANTCTISGIPAATGTFPYTVTADNAAGCSATIQGTLTVTGINQLQGNCTFTQPPVVGTFATFPASYNASTYVTLTDERDNNNYTVVKIGGRWWMGQNLNYQIGLTYLDQHDLPASNVAGSNTATFSVFWCPADNTNETDVSVCDYWGALYAWETAMMLDGKGTWTEALGNYCTGAADSPECKINHGRSASSGTAIDGRGICPPNWHVPSDFELGQLMDTMESGGGTIHQTTTANGSYIGTNAGTRGKAKCSGGSSDTNPTWDSGVGTDDFNFRGIPADDRNYNGTNDGNLGLYAIFWSSSASNASRAWERSIYAANAGVRRLADIRSFGLSIRCVRDE